MKKGMIVVVVLLFASVLFLKYIQRKSAGEKRIASPVSSELKDEGISLPDGARSYDLKDDINIHTVRKLASLSERYGSISMCENGSVDKILKNYSKLWGYGHSTERLIKSGKKNEKLHEMVKDLFVCVGLVNGDYSYCDNLPKGYVKFGSAKEKIHAGESIGDKCEEKMSDITCMGYMSGMLKESSHCEKYFFPSLNEDSDEINIFENIPKKDVCNMAGEGLEKFCEVAVKAYPGLDRNKCLIFFPRKKSDCRKSGDKGEREECLETAQMYDAFKKGDHRKCPNEYKDLCNVFFSHSSKACESIARRLSKTYCDYTAEINKAGAMEREKIEKERRKKENEAALKKINERVRKILGKDKDE